MIEMMMILWKSKRLDIFKNKEGSFSFYQLKRYKVVNQLNQVANDSEEKVSQIFDVLSLTLDNNNELKKKKKYEIFSNKKF